MDTNAALQGGKALATELLNLIDATNFDNMKILDDKTITWLYAIRNVDCVIGIPQHKLVCCL
jgi:hypothetical protein